MNYSAKFYVLKFVNRAALIYVFLVLVKQTFVLCNSTILYYFNPSITAIEAKR